MWTRKELKDKAKIAFKANYWKTVLVALLLAILVGGMSSFGSASSFTNPAVVGPEGGNTPSTVHIHTGDGGADDVDIVLDDQNTTIRTHNDEGHPVVVDAPSSTVFGIGAVFVGLSIFLIFLVILAVALAVNAFILNPLEVGAQRFMLRNLNQPSEVKEVAHAFDTNYRETVKGMFIRDMCTLAWGLLFIVPGIVKSYEYRMMPYLYADDPTMTKERAFAESKQMMTGQKWNAFVLDLSFLGWNILSALTMGILGVFYVNPYQHQTNAALYEKLRYGLPAPAPAPAPGPVPVQPGYAPYASPSQQPYDPFVQQPYAPSVPQANVPSGPQAYAPSGPQVYAPASQPPVPPFAAVDAPAPTWDEPEPVDVDPEIAPAPAWVEPEPADVDPEKIKADVANFLELDAEALEAPSAEVAVAAEAPEVEAAAEAVGAEAVEVEAVVEAEIPEAGSGVAEIEAAAEAEGSEVEAVAEVEADEMPSAPYAPDAPEDPVAPDSAEA